MKGISKYLKLLNIFFISLKNKNFILGSSDKPGIIPLSL